MSPLEQRKRIARQQFLEKLVRQFPRRIHVPAFPAEKRQHWLVVRTAQFAHRHPRIPRLPARGQNLRPMGRMKPGAESRSRHAVR